MKHTFAQSPSQLMMLRAASNISPKAIKVVCSRGEKTISSNLPKSHVEYVCRIELMLHNSQHHMKHIYAIRNATRLIFL